MNDKKIFIRISDDEKKLIQEAARREGRTMSNYIRNVLYKTSRNICKLPPEAD